MATKPDKVVRSAKRQRTKSTFSSVDDLYSHLSSPKKKITVFGALHRMADDDKRVMFSPNGQHWVPVPINIIQDAKGLGDDSGDLVHSVQLTLSRPSKASGLVSQLSTMPGFATAAQPPSPPTSPPPECGDKFPVWVYDHWECR